jgi:hypothetical protein
VALTLVSAYTVRSTKTAESGDRTASDDYTSTARTSWTDGTGAGACSKEYASPQATLGTVADTYDLSGSLANAISEAAVFTAIKVVEFKTPTTNTGTVTFCTGATPWSAFVAGTLTLPPGARVGGEVTGGTYWTVSAGTSDIIRVSGTSGDKYQIYVAGE